MWFEHLWKSKQEILVKWILRALRLFIGKILDSLWILVSEKVKLAESTNEPGSKKFELVYKNVKDNILSRDTPTYLLKILIETAVFALKEGVLDKFK